MSESMEILERDEIYETDFPEEADEVKEAGEEETGKKTKKKGPVRKAFDFIYKLVPFVLLFLVPYLNFRFLQEYVNYDILTGKLVFLNVILYELFALVLVFLTKRIRVALFIETLIVAVFGLAEYYVVSFRSTPIMPWDIFAAGTAATVAGGYDFSLKGKALSITIKFAVMLFVIITMFIVYRKKKIEIKLPVRLTALLVAIAALVTAGVIEQRDAVMDWAGYYPYQFTPIVMMRKNGIVSTLVYDLKYMKMAKPEGYSAKEEEEILESYADDSTIEEEKHYPNVVAIMNETWSDLSVLDLEMNTNMEMMPFTKELMQSGENTIAGNCHVSIVGGNTANSEFEFCTGNSMEFMPEGSIPYMNFIKDGMPSVFSHMEGLGFETYFFHPNYETAWNRKNVYTNFGVDFIRFNDLDGNDNVSTYVPKIRTLASDSFVFENIKSVLSTDEKDKSAFTFAVTIQNHGGYTKEHDNFFPAVEVEEIDSLVLSTYLSLMNETDMAFKNLLTWLENFDEDTIVVMFGDHQPNDYPVIPLYKYNGKDVNDLSPEEYEKRFITPYVIWANFDIEEEYGKDSCPNFLAAQTLAAAGIPTSDYQNYLLDLAEEVPVVSVSGVEAAEGIDEATVAEKVEEYRKLSYYRMNDYK